MDETVFSGVLTRELARVTVVVGPDGIVVREAARWWEDAARSLLIGVMVLVALPFAGLAGMRFADGDAVGGWVFTALAVLVLWPLVVIFVDKVVGVATVLGLLIALPVVVFFYAGRARIRNVWTRYATDASRVPVDDIARVRVTERLWTTVRVKRHRGPSLYLRITGPRKAEFAAAMRQLSLMD